MLDSATGAMNVLPLLDSSFVDICYGIASGNLSSSKVSFGTWRQCAEYGWSRPAMGRSQGPTSRSRWTRRQWRKKVRRCSMPP